MLIRFSLAVEGGVEIFARESKEIFDSMIHPQLFSGMIDAIHMVSIEINNPIKKVNFANMILFVRIFHNYSIRLIFDQDITEKEVDNIFLLLNNVIEPLLKGRNELTCPSQEIFEEKLSPVLKPFMQDPITQLEDKNVFEDENKRIIKIALVGLGNAGKTSIKNMFFEKWTKEMVQNISPTVGLERTHNFHTFLDQKILINDFGGQQIYRDQYIDDLEYWQQITSLIFVIDIQSPNFFEVAKDYFEKVWTIIKSENPIPPKISIFLHKYDPMQRKEFSSNIKNCLDIFRQYIDIGTLYLTSIEDESSSVAMIKSLYFALPEVMLKCLFEDDFAEQFNKEIVAKFSWIIENAEINTLFLNHQETIKQSAIIIGRNYSSSFQKRWFDYLIGSGNISRTKISNKLINISQKNQKLYLTISHSIAPKLPNDFLVLLLSGFLEGIGKSMFLKTPRIFENTEEYTIWEIL